MPPDGQPSDARSQKGQGGQSPVPSENEASHPFTLTTFPPRTTLSGQRLEHTIDLASGADGGTTSRVVAPCRFLASAGSVARRLLVFFLNNQLCPCHMQKSNGHH